MATETANILGIKNGAWYKRKKKIIFSYASIQCLMTQFHKNEQWNLV
jgi:hypothetical protein